MKRILIVAGESSGDQHAALLIRDAHELNPNLRFYGMGGRYMREAGADVHIDIRQLAVVGITEILVHLPVIYQAYRTLKNELLNNPPDLLILVDYPDFNLRLAKVAHKFGIKVLYYISPHIWAWRKHRIHAIRKYVTHMAVILPFERDFYTKENVPVSYVGNPLAKKAIPTVSKEEAFIQFGLNPQKKIIALLPGSRKGEIKQMLPTLIATAQLLYERDPNCQFVLPLASTLTEADIQSYWADNTLPISIIHDHLYDVLQVCNAAIAVSGTVTLETAMIGTPLVIIYKISPLSYYIAKCLIKTRFIGLCNIVAGESVAPELIQHAANPKAIADEINRLLEENTQQTIRAKLKKLQAKMLNDDGYTRIGTVLCNLLAVD